MPVIDGLDELPPDDRSSALIAVNTALGDNVSRFRNLPHIRVREAVSAGDVVTAAAVIEAQPLRADERSQIPQERTSVREKSTAEAIFDHLLDNPTGLRAAIGSPW